MIILYSYIIEEANEYISFSNNEFVNVLIQTWSNTSG